MQSRILTAYTGPAFAAALPTIPVYIYLPTLYGVHLDLGLTITGIVLLISRLIDTLTDPLIGLLSDKFAFRNNYRKPWIAAGALIAGIGIHQLLSPDLDAGVGYLLVWSITLYVGWTMFAVPYLAWGAELSSDYHERTRITSYREGTSILGILAAGALIAGATFMGWSEPKSIGLLAWITIFAGASSLPFLLFLVPDSELTRVKVSNPTKTPFLSSVKSLIKNKLFMRLLSAWLLNGIANGIPAVLFFLYLDNILGTTETQRAIYVVLYFGCTVLAMPIWLHLSKLIGKHKIWCWAMIIASVSFVTVIFLPEGSFICFGLVCVITGMCLAADLSLPPAMQADVVDYDALKFKKRRTGLLFALWGMSTKLALAISIGFAFPALDLLGFDPKESDPEGKIFLVVIYAIVPVVLKLVTICIIWKFPLDSRRHNIVTRRLESAHR